MSVTSRVLPAEEWGRLDGTELRDTWRALQPETTRVLVVEDGERIVGHWVLMHTINAHACRNEAGHEGAAALMALAARVGEEWGVSRMLTSSESAGLSRLLRRHGAVPVPGDHFALPLGGR